MNTFRVKRNCLFIAITCLFLSACASVVRNPLPEELYTTLDTTQLINTRSLFSILGADSVVDTTPLSNVLKEAIDDELVAALAREHKKGRILSVGTTNMDAGRPVVWNLTRVAASGHPDAPKLIREVLLASASIPGAFPPVYIEVEAFDPKYMKALLEFGYEQTLNGETWWDFESMMSAVDRVEIAHPENGL
jgi:predicted acylesterase/phospholipase RssA